MTRNISQYSFATCEETLRGGIGKVTLMGWVVQSAGRDFSLWTQKEILQFIVSGGLQNPVFIHSKEFVRSVEIPAPICDRYRFEFGFDEGYLSYFFSNGQKKWVIKSLHRADEGSETTFRLAFRNAEYLTEEG